MAYETQTPELTNVDLHEVVDQASLLRQHVQKLEDLLAGAEPGHPDYADAERWYRVNCVRLISDLQSDLHELLEDIRA